MSKPIGTFPDFFAPGDDFYDIESELPTLPSYHAEPVFGGARLATVHFAHQEAQLLQLGGGARAARRIGVI